MKVEFWDNERPIAPFLRLEDDRNYVNGISTYRFGVPRLDAELCNDCSLCWIYCPEGAITRGPEGLIIDFEDCRGCGLCAHECPRQAFSMVEDTNA